MYGDEIEPPLDKDIWNISLEELPHFLFCVWGHLGYQKKAWKLQVSDPRRWLQ
jgi:hypothetical protein